MLPADQWARVKELFSDALETPTTERLAFVRAQCTGDEAVYENVVSLLAAHGEADTFIEQPALASVTDLVAADPTLIGERIGAYRIESEIGRGGMGVVYQASRADKEFSQRVAIKLIKRGLDTDDIIRRFRAERQILAALNHPNIARLIDGGATESGLPYLVMDFVEGRPLTVYCHEQRLPIGKRLQLFQQICSAVHYAHQNLIIHRDLKPSNVLVTADNIPKLLDFGIAKLIAFDKVGDTAEPATANARAMTPEYASPEQMLGLPVTTAADIYSLGVVLYELLTGHRPFNFNNYRPDEIIHLINETAPTRPSAALERETREGDSIAASVPFPPSALRGDLDNIILMALRKEPERRYGSVEQFAGDIRNYLGGLPVIARQDTFGYRASKFIKRNKAAVAAGLGIGASLIAGIAATSRQARIARGQRDKARLEADKAETLNQFLEKTLSAADPRIKGKDVKVVEILSLAAESIDTDFREQPESLANIHTTIGLTYLSLGLNGAAEPHLRDALALRSQLFPRQHPDVALSLYNLGQVLQAKGNQKEAEPLYREALASIRPLGGKWELQLASVLDGLGYLLFLNGEHEAALRAHTEELEIRVAKYGEVHPEVARTKGKLANVLALMGRKDEAEHFHRQALAIMRRFHREEHPDVAQAIIDLVGAIHTTKFAEAADLCHEALAMRRRLLGNDHPDVAWALYNMAFTLIAASRHLDAIPFIIETLALHGRSLSDEHPIVNSALVQMGICLLRLNRYQDARGCLEEALDLRERTLPADHWLVSTNRSILGECLTSLGEYELAEPLLRESCDLLAAKLGPEHEQTIKAQWRLTRFGELQST